MARFGVTAWLDEAIEVAPEHREKILGALKDLTGIDKFLLGTMQTATKIEELQRYLAEQQMDGVTICTPERTYKVTRSRYGQRQHLNTTSNPKAKVDLFAIAAKPQELEKAQQDFRDAKRASDDHLEGKERLQERVHQANEFRKARQQELATFNDGFAGVAAIEKRLPASLQRVEQARKEEAAFDVGARRSELQAKLVQMAKGEAQLTTRVAKQQVALTKASSDEYGARLAMRVAMQQMADVKEAQDEMNKEVRVTQDEVERLKEQFAAAVHDAKKKRDEARRAAPQFEMDPTTMLRGTEATQREWDAMPNELDALDAEIESLEEDIASSDDDDGKTLRDYEERCKQIEAMKDTVAGTRGEIDAKRDRLAAQVAQWKPQLEQMVAVVDDNFAAYFRRFKCVGRVELVDGRKRSPVTGEAEGIDDFAQYKIHIKVQWRENESLHVLGEGGRDSGGERSVATMVYLISLQSVNPAPFRVVDEINQAMDSTNERHVFECITHACREGGKQYFLLTPKLLPDLDYGEETAIQLVLNGPYAVNRSAFTLAKYC